jgi:hypothetical protein
MYNLNKTDKDFLYKKYIQNGCTPVEAYKNIKQLSDSLKFYMAKLQAKKLNEAEMKDKFRQEFEKMCMKLEK